MRFLITLSALALAPLLHAQTTHVVTGGGNALQLAISAAAPGDILDVLPGTYSAVTASRGLRILLRAGALVAAPSPGTTSAITVSRLPAGEAFAVVGGTVHGIAALDCQGAIVLHRLENGSSMGSDSRFERCTGPVLLQEVTAGPLRPTRGSLTLLDCAQASFTGCSLPRTSVTNSHATFAGVVIEPYGGSLPPGAMPSLRIDASSVSIADGDIRGGVSASLPYHESGILLQLGDLVLTGGTYVQESILWSSPTVPAIATNGGTLRIDPSVVLVGAPPIGGTAVVTTAYTPSLAATHAPGTSICQLDIVAEPNSIVFTLANLPTTPMPSPFGELWLVPQSPILDIAALPATGHRTFAFTLGPVPPLLGLVAQSASLSPSGAIAVGAPVRFLWD